MTDDTPAPSTRAVANRNTKRRAKRPALERMGEKLPQITVADYSAMSPLAIGQPPTRRGKKREL